MPHPSPKPLKRGLRYINKAYNSLLRYVQRTRVIPRDGWTETDQGVMPPPYSQADACSALSVAVDASDEYTQNPGIITTSGATASGWTGIPTLISGAVTASEIVYLELTFDAVDTGSETTAWELSAAVFDSALTLPSEDPPVWSGSWDKTTFDVAQTWASVDASKDLVSTRCGNVAVIFCNLDPVDIRMVAAGPEWLTVK